MSKFRVDLDISFDTEDEAIAFINMIEELKSNVFTGTGSESIPIEYECRYHECFHDETPPKPCGGYVYVDFNGAASEHKNKEGDVIKYKTLDITTEKKTKV